MAREYIFKKNFWGEWVLVPKEENNGGFALAMFLLVLLILSAAILISPFWTALLGFAMVKRKRYWAGIFSILAFTYVFIDIKKGWLSSFWFSVFRESTGEISDGLIEGDYLYIVHIINGVGLFIAYLFSVGALAQSKSARRRIIRLTFFILIIGVGGYFLYSYTQGLRAEEKAWEHARKINSVSSFENYRTHYSEGKYHTEATDNIHGLRAIESGNPEKIRRLLSLRPENPQAQSAWNWLAAYEADSAAWALTCMKNSVSGYEWYLEQYPSGRYRLLARDKVQKIAGLVGEKGFFIDDRDGRKYAWVRIGEQVWMAENLAYSTPSGSWIDTYNPTKMGGYYNWKNAQELAPEGWHLPSKKEFEILLATIGGEGPALFHRMIKNGGVGYESVLAGVFHFSSNRDGGWLSSEGTDTFYWTATGTEYPEHAYALHLDGEKRKAEMTLASKSKGYSLRFIKD